MLNVAITVNTEWAFWLARLIFQIKIFEKCYILFWSTYNRLALYIFTILSVFFIIDFIETIIQPIFLIL